MKHIFDKLFNHGAIFVVFADRPEEITYYYGAANPNGLDVQDKIGLSNWLFLDVLRGFDLLGSNGYEIRFEAPSSELTALLSRGGGSSEYSCTIAPNVSRVNWVSLAKNKYGSEVAGVVTRQDDAGHLIVLPQMPNIHHVIVEMLETVLAEWAPSLFPSLEGKRWVQRPEYEIPRVVELQKRVTEIRQRAEKEIEEIKSEIEAIREDNQDWSQFERFFLISRGFTALNKLYKALWMTDVI